MQKEAMTVTERKDENVVVEKLFRMLVDKMERPEFPPGGVSLRQGSMLCAGRHPRWVAADWPHEAG